MYTLRLWFAYSVNVLELLCDHRMIRLSAPLKYAPSQECSHAHMSPLCIVLSPPNSPKATTEANCIYAMDNLLVLL